MIRRIIMVAVILLLMPTFIVPVLKPGALKRLMKVKEFSTANASSINDGAAGDGRPSGRP